MNNDLYKDRYDFEWNHRSHLLGVTNICIVAAAIIGSGLVAEAQGFNYASDLKCIFLSIWILSAFSFATSLYFIARSLIGYGYSHIATPSELQNHHKELLKWCETNNHQVSVADSKLEEFINSKMAEAVDINLENNKKKSAYNQKSMIFVFIALALLSLAAVPFLLSINGKVDVLNVNVVNPISISQETKKMTTENGKDNKTTNQTTTSKPETQIPQGPQNTIIKEHKEKSETKIK